MNGHRLHLWLCHSRSLTKSRLPRYLSYFLPSKNYATRHDQSSLLSQALDQKHRAAQRDNSVGPFQLGLVQPTSGDGPAQKKWSELSTGGKVVRTTARTTNLTVILLGAGLSAVLIYALTSELFSKNSPTVLYGDACERIKASPRLAKYLHAPFAFHNNPPSVIRPRHRNHHVSSYVAVDASGREHMFLNFYVEGSSSFSSSPSASMSYLTSVVDWTKKMVSAVPELSIDDARTWAMDTWEMATRAFKYLSGSPVPPRALPHTSSTSRDMQTKDDGSSGGWSLAGMFAGLKGVRGGPTEEVNAGADGVRWTDGEVHADLVRNDDGYFVFRYLMVEIPSSRVRHPVRVWVHRGPGVPDNEPIMRFTSSS